MDIESFSAPAICTVVYVLIELLKKAVGNKEALKRWYPLIAAVLGMLLGFGAYMTQLLPILADSIPGAIMIGLCSGLCATGTDQLIHRIIKEKNEKK